MPLRAVTRVTNKPVTHRPRHTPKIPNFDRTVLTASYQPLAFAVKTDRGDIGVVAFKRDELNDTDQDHS